MPPDWDGDSDNDEPPPGCLTRAVFVGLALWGLAILAIFVWRWK